MELARPRLVPTKTGHVLSVSIMRSAWRRRVLLCSDTIRMRGFWIPVWVSRNVLGWEEPGLQFAMDLSYPCRKAGYITCCATVGCGMLLLCFRIAEAGWMDRLSDTPCC